VGCLNIVARTKQETQRVFSQLSVLQRSEISNPPTFGARIVSLILNDAELFEEWKRDIKTMAHRIIDMRKGLHAKLIEQGAKSRTGNWDHIVSQIGMFAFTGLTPEQCKAVVEKGHVYLTGNGRISMAGLNSHNLDYFAEVCAKATKGEL